MENFVTFTTPDDKTVVLNAIVVRRLETGSGGSVPSRETTILVFDHNDRVEVLGSIKETVEKIVHYQRYFASGGDGQSGTDRTSTSASDGSLSRVLGRG